MNTEEIKTSRRQTQIGQIKLDVGKSLFNEGDLGKELYLLESGQLMVTQGSGKDAIQLAQLEQGAIVGEMALFDGQPRSANVIATQISIVKVIPQAAFNKMINLLPIWLKAIIKIVVSRLREANQRMEKGSIPNTNLSLLQFLTFESEFNHLDSFEYFELLDLYCLNSRASKKEFKDAVNKLVQLEILSLVDNENGSQDIVIHNLTDIKTLVGIFKDYKNKRAILAKELTEDSKKIMTVLIEQIKKNKLEIEIDKFVELYQELNPRLSEGSMNQLVKFMAIQKDETKISINRDLVSQISHQLKCLPLLKKVLK